MKQREGKKGRGVALAAILVGTAIVAGAALASRMTPLSATEFEDESKKVNDKKMELMQKREELSRQIAALEKDKKDVMQYIETLDGQMQALEEEETRIEADIESTDRELAAIRGQLEEAKTRESSQYEIMKKRIKYMYENGSSDYLDIILSAGTISEFLNRAEYVSKISKYDETILTNYQETKKEVEGKEKEASNKLIDLNMLKEEKKIQKSAIKEMAGNKHKELKKYNKAIASSDEQMQEYTAEIERQEKMLDDLILQEQKRIQEEFAKQERERAKANKEDEGGDDGESADGEESQPSESPTEEEPGDVEVPSVGYQWPLSVAGTITSNFGPRMSPTAGASSYHQGIDVGVPTGTPILAAQSGKVVKATYQAAAGNYIMILHDDGVFTIYMHCSALAVGVGKEVRKGEIIGLVGSTGISTGPHLHFGISVNGSYVNPLLYVSQ